MKIKRKTNKAFRMNQTPAHCKRAWMVKDTITPTPLTEMGCFNCDHREDITTERCKNGSGRPVLGEHALHAFLANLRCLKSAPDYVIRTAATLLLEPHRHELALRSRASYFSLLIAMSKCTGCTCWHMSPEHARVYEKMPKTACTDERLGDDEDQKEQADGKTLRFTFDLPDLLRLAKPTVPCDISDEDICLVDGQQACDSCRKNYSPVCGDIGDETRSRLLMEYMDGLAFQRIHEFHDDDGNDAVEPYISFSFSSVLGFLAVLRPAELYLMILEIHQCIEDASDACMLTITPSATTTKRIAAIVEASGRGEVLPALGLVMQARRPCTKTAITKMQARRHKCFQDRLRLAKELISRNRSIEYEHQFLESRQKRCFNCIEETTANTNIILDPGFMQLEPCGHMVCGACALNVCDDMTCKRCGGKVETTHTPEIESVRRAAQQADKKKKKNKKSKQHKTRK